MSLSHSSVNGAEGDDPGPLKARVESEPPLERTFVVTLGGEWRLFTNPVAGHHMMGTVQVGMQYGALAKSHEGRWVQVIEGIPTPLPQQRIAEAVQAARAHMRHPIRFD